MSKEPNRTRRDGWGQKQRAERALVRQLSNQTRKAHAVLGRENDVMAFRQNAANRVRALLESLHPIPDDARILEVGSGAHGFIFFWPTSHGIGVDPLALQYVPLFPRWQRTPTASALGEALPFPDGCFDVVLTDNVVDHAESPSTIISEIARVLRPGGVLYFAVNIHHPFYALASSLHGGLQVIGLPFEITPFADHTTHFTLTTAHRLFKDLPLRILYEHSTIPETKAGARQMTPRHPGDLLKRLFFKNARFEVVAVRET